MCSVNVSVCARCLTWLPWLLTEAAGGHIRCSGGAAAAPHGETEVAALPQTEQQPVRSLPVSTPAGLYLTLHLKCGTVPLRDNTADLSHDSPGPSQLT